MLFNSFCIHTWECQYIIRTEYPTQTDPLSMLSIYGVSVGDNLWSLLLGNK